MYGKGIQVKKDDEEAKMAQEDLDYNDVVLIMTTTNAKSFNSERWFLGIGYSNLLTGNREWMKEIDTIKTTKVKLVDHRTLTTKEWESL